MDQARKQLSAYLDDVVEAIRRAKGHALDNEDYEAQNRLRDLEKEALSVKSLLTTDLRQVLAEANRLNTPGVSGCIEVDYAMPGNDD